MSKRMSRRQLLQLLAAAAGQLSLSTLTSCTPLVGRAEDGLEPRAYLPFVGRNAPSSAPTATPGTGEIPTATSTSTPTPTPTHTPTATFIPSDTPTPPPTGPRVVHVHDTTATSWNGETAYWDYVNQSKVDTMMDQGLMALTGATTVAAAWTSLLPNYTVGEGIAIKVNFNNSTACNDADAQIDALIQPVNAIVRGLKARGVAEADIWVYDASRRIPDRFVNGSLYSGVPFFDAACRTVVTWSSNDPDAYITFSPPAGASVPPATRISDLLIDATYLINMPIMKPHGLPGVTLTFKNHFGNITSPFQLHPYIGPSGAHYRTDYNPLIDIYLNPHVGAKTVLVVGDALIAARRFNVAPETWTTFGDQVPNSLFLATDPVAIDCVMSDLLGAEVTLPDSAADYLVLAGAAGLGTFEHGDPWGTGYNEIDYHKIELGTR